MKSTFFPALLLLIGSGFGFASIDRDRAAASLTATPAIAAEVPGKEENMELIPWSVRRVVGWEDFQGPVLMGTEAVASTNTSLGLSYQLRGGKLSYEITCTFSKTKSWGMLKNDYILAHEQGHFDITELCARYLYKALSEYTYNRGTYKQDITRIYNEIVAKKEALQEQYDGETDHSRKRKLQKEWEERIESMLEETAPYAQYP
ncbi:DUF922 domain-containing protein [Flaviaesturariibacter amylovorans]|uniref:DUF922 domain-containing protein n=1 Tax=Flaviaesturariibacter amylovorans TaxID=1084520 RepID=A0ABP8HCG6_9BACT